MGVVWGEGPVNQHGRAVGADICDWMGCDWIGRLVRAMWRRLSMHGGEV